MDDLSERVDAGFARVDSSLLELGRRIDVQGSELGRRIDAQGARMDALQRTMLQVGGAMIGTTLATLATVLATSF